MLTQLFLTFFLVGLVSFGGGYSMIPLIQEEVLNRYHWMNATQLSDIIAVAGMSPGPIATNIAVAVGYHQDGWIGAIIASLAVVLPSLILILAIGRIFVRIHNQPLFKSTFYGVRPVVAGMIVYAAISFAQNAGMFARLSWFTWTQIAIFAGSLGALFFFHKHPVSVIVVSGLVGIALYS